VTEKKQVPHTG